MQFSNEYTKNSMNVGQNQELFHMRTNHDP